MSAIYDSADDGKTFNQLVIDDVPRFAAGGIFDEEYPNIFVNEVSGTLKLKMSKKGKKVLNQLLGKKHRSRKWKKKRGLLKRQRKRKFKNLKKCLLEFEQIAKKSSRQFWALRQSLGETARQIEERMGMRSD